MLNPFRKVAPIEKWSPIEIAGTSIKRSISCLSNKINQMLLFVQFSKVA